MKVAIYARVSTRDKDQNPETQLRLLRQEAERLGLEIHREYVDQASALDMRRRVGWRALMNDAKSRKFRTVLVYKLDRAFRSVTHVHHTLAQLENYGVQFKSYVDPIDTTTSMGRFSLTILAAVAELERDLISDRVLAGIAHAQAVGTKSGKPIGRPRAKVNVQKVLDAYRDTGKIRAAARIADCSPGTADRIIKGAQSPL